MKRFALVAAGVTSGVFASAAPGLAAPSARVATANIVIEHGGYAPNYVALHVGDYVHLRNADDRVQEIGFSPSVGISCIPKHLVLAPKAVALCGFATPGTFHFSNPKLGGVTFRGTVRVTPATVPASITSSASATFTTGTAESFDITASGVPLPTISIEGALPSGLSFAAIAPGEAAITGSATALPGSYTVTVLAANGVGGLARESLTLDVVQPPAPGYAIAGATGAVDVYGQTHAGGQIAVNPRVRPVVAIARSPGDFGYYLATSRGGVYNLGGAPFFGSAAARHLAAPITDLAATPDGRGYWLLDASGAVYPYGDARSYSALHLKPRAPRAVALAPTPDGRGYFVATSAGNVYPFGDASFSGSPASRHFRAHVVGLLASPDGRGYWVATREGNVYNFGDARFFGSMASSGLRRTIVALVPTLDAGGYYLVTSEGNVYNFGDARFYGSPARTGRRARIVGAAIPD